MNNYFKVLRPGINSTFQDLGRFGLQHLGIVASGCMDQLTFCTSNKLVGNKISEGALEFAYQGPLIEHVGETVLVAISGKVNFNIIKENDELIKGKPNESFLISNGEKIDILSTINSVYGYFSIFGGFKIEEVKGSVSTLVKAKIGISIIFLFSGNFIFEYSLLLMNSIISCDLICPNSKLIINLLYDGV